MTPAEYAQVVNDVNGLYKELEAVGKEAQNTMWCFVISTLATCGIAPLLGGMCYVIAKNSSLAVRPLAFPGQLPSPVEDGRIDNGLCVLGWQNRRVAAARRVVEYLADLNNRVLGPRGVSFTLRTNSLIVADQMNNRIMNNDHVRARSARWAA